MDEVVGDPHLDENELVILRQGVEAGQPLGELHHLLDCGGHAQGHVEPQHGAGVGHAVRGGAGCFLPATP